MPATDSVPEIDLGCPDELHVAAQIVDALTSIGFFFVKNHGIEDSLVEGMFQQSVSFFQQGLADKMRLRRDWQKATCGFIPLSEDSDGPAVERFSLDMPPDRKELLDVCHSCTSWPSDQFELAARSLIGEAQRLVLRLLGLLGRGLRLEPSDSLARAFGNFGGAGNSSQLRLLHYPPCGADPGCVRCGEHTDYGCLTLVFTDTHPGLQVLSRSGQYVDIPASAGQLLVNIGDLMHRWTGGVLHSARHRVVLPADSELRQQPRHSVVYFAHCDDDYVVRPLLGDVGKFAEVRTSEHYGRRFEETFLHGQGVDPQL